MVVLGEKVWQSEWIELRAGQSVEVVAEPQEPASVTVQPLNDSGAAMMASLLYRDTGRYCSQRDLKPSPGSGTPGIQASPDQAGVARLTNLPPGHQTVCVQGENTEILRFEVMLTAGSVCDLGFVRLPRAKGRIEVELTGSESDAAFALELLQPMRAPIMEPTPIVDSRASIEALPCRRYTVAIRVNATGRCYWRSVELSEASPRAVVSFDVSTPPAEDE